MSLTFADEFAGIDGFGLGFARAGLVCTHQSELIEARQRTLARHFPNVPRGGDIRHVNGADLGSPAVVAAGFPCKDTSIAAPHRQGLDGARSGLFWEFHRLVDESLRLVEYANPRWVVIENTPGLLNSRQGRDLAAVACGLEQLGYGWAFRVVDGRHFGTPQRRRRLIMVGHRGGDPRPAWQVLGDLEAGRPVAPAGGVGGRQGRPRAVGGGSTGDVVVWRKSSRARMAIAKGGVETWRVDDFSNTLTGFDGGLATRQTHLLSQHGRLRTLTLTEWERLSGFPDGWTEGMTDSERYSALGDCFQPTVAEWLGRRLVAVDAALPQIGTAA